MSGRANRGTDAREDQDSRPGRDLRGPETSSRAPSSGARPSPTERQDARGEPRDPTRSKPRRKPTAAQRAARDRTGSRLVRAGSSAKERRDTSRPILSPRERPSASARAKERSPAAEPRLPPVRELPGGAFERGPCRYDGRGVSLRLTGAQAAALDDIGRFRVVRTDAALRHLFGGDAGPARAQLAELRSAGLVRDVQERYLTLTHAGRALAAAMQTDPRQQVYAGVKRPRELKHDSAVYDAYQHARRGLEADGNRVTVVRLDYEMKRDIGREAYVAAAKDLRARGQDIQELPQDERRDAIKQAAVPVAAARELPADEDGVDYPDLQIEYERPDGTIGRSNVEVVTEHYHEATLAAKEAAGFQLYLPVDSFALRGDKSGRAPRSVHSLAEELFEI